MTIRQGSQIDESSVIILVLDKSDIESQLESYFEDEEFTKKQQTKRINQIFGMAKSGKFTDIVMNDFWESIDTCNNIIEDYDDKTQKYYEDLGVKIEVKN